MARVGSHWMLAAATPWLVAGCSQLFDSERVQCKVSADCAAKGHGELSCIEGLCTLDGTSNRPDDGEPGDGAGDGTPGGGGTQADGADDGANGDGADDGANGDGADDGANGDGTDGDGADGSESMPDCQDGVSYRFCNGFENDFAGWEREVDEGTRMTVVSNKPARGTRALEVETLSRGDRWSAVRASYEPVQGEAVWARAFVWAYGDVSYDAVTVLRVESDDEKDGVDVTLVGGRTPTAQLFGGFGDAEHEKDDGQRFPLDTWTCVEIAFLPAFLGGSIQLHVDGREAATIDTILPIVTFSRLRAGIFFTASEQTPTIVALDGVAVSTTRIGCN